MRIGIVSPIDIVTFLPFISSEKDKNSIIELAHVNLAPAVNTLALSLIKRGHFIRIFTLGNKDLVIREKQIEIFIVKEYQKYPVCYLWGIFYNAEQLQLSISNNLDDIDVIHSHWTYEYAYSTMEVANKLPVFCTVRDWAPLIFKYESFKNKVSWVFKLIMANKVYASKNIHFIANSPYTANVLMENKGIVADVLPNSIKDDFFVDETKIKQNKEFRILSIASSHDGRKNMISLFRSFALLCKKYDNFVLEVIGPQFRPNHKDIKDIYDEGLVTNKVNLIGEVNHNDLKKYLDNASVFVTPSLEETFGNTLLEAIARKIPVIGGMESGAVPYVLHQGECGFLCDVKKPEAIAAMIEKVYMNYEEAYAKALHAYDVIKNEYSESVICDKHISLYKKYLMSKNG